MSAWQSVLFPLLVALALAACSSSPATASDETPASDPALLLRSPAEPDRSCTVDADCAVKNVGNCCGYYPACVNAKAETFPAEVKLACEREGRMSICGFEEISSCRCVAQQCAPAKVGGSEVM